MNPLLFISSLPFLDLLDNLIVLAAEFVAIFCLNEEAHSQFWFMFLLMSLNMAANLVYVVPPSPRLASTSASARTRPFRPSPTVRAFRCTTSSNARCT